VETTLLTQMEACGGSTRCSQYVVEEKKQTNKQTNKQVTWFSFSFFLLLFFFFCIPPHPPFF